MYAVEVRVGDMQVRYEAPTLFEAMEMKERGEGTASIPDDRTQTTISTEGSRKMMRFLFSPEALACLGPGNYEVRENPIPKGARVVGCCFDDQTGLMSVVFEHESFPSTYRGDVIPVSSGAIKVRVIH